MDFSFDPIDLLGYAAAFLVFLTFCMKTLLWLRMIAVASNLVFIAYAVGAGLIPILILHGVLLPLNLFRLWEHYAVIQRTRAATRGDVTVSALLPFMERRKVPGGATIFRKGDMADRLFYVQAGRVEVLEFGKFLEPGEIFGEVGLFSEGRSRTATVRAIEPSVVLEIDRASVLRVCRETPELALLLARVITDRMVDNQAELSRQLEAVRVAGNG
jgi:hypothetical protein